MKLSKYDTSGIIGNLRTFSYKTKNFDGEEITVNAELFPSNMTNTVNMIFMQEFGNLRALEIMESLKNEEITAETLAEMIKILCVEKWGHYLGMWTSTYDPIANVDGVESITVETEYGKITTKNKGTTLTDEQKVQGTHSTQYGKKDDLTHGHVETKANGLVVTTTEPTNTKNVVAYDNANWIPKEQSSATQHSTTNSGQDSITNSGKDTHELSGTDVLTINEGKVEHTTSGYDEDELSGTDTTTTTHVRHGNIGVTMTQQLLTAEKDFWQKMDFFHMWFADIANYIALPLYEMEV